MAGAPVVSAQSVPTRLAVLQAGERGGQTTADLRTLRTAARSTSGDTVRLAVRTLGRLERVSLIPDILPALKHPLPEVRSEAANALAQSAAGFSRGTSPPVASIQSVQASLIDRLGFETDEAVRAVLCDAIARLPYRNAADVDRAERALLDRSGERTTVDDRLGAARALESLIRLHGALRPASSQTLATLRGFLLAATGATERSRDARVRRLALEALIEARAVDAAVVEAGFTDPDPQVRRLAIVAARTAHLDGDHDVRGLADPVSMVRLEAIRSAAAKGGDSCRHLLAAVADPELMIGLVAIDGLTACGHAPEAMAYLVAAVADRGEINTPRGWHRNAHALVALAVAAPDRLGDAALQHALSRTWQVRRAAATVGAAISDTALLGMLSNDPEPRVAEVARRALGLAAPAADPVQAPPTITVTAEELERLASPRARITIRDVGRFDLALVASEAPLTVVQFVRLAESGYYDNAAFDLLTPNSTLQVGYRSTDPAAYTTVEVGLWPHVRGTLGVATPTTGDAQFFLNLVDNPRFDHQYTVFAQVLTGQAVVDRILEGDIIESIEILP